MKRSAIAGLATAATRQSQLGSTLNKQYGTRTLRGIARGNRSASSHVLARQQNYINARSNWYSGASVLVSCHTRNSVEFSSRLTDVVRGFHTTTAQEEEAGSASTEHYLLPHPLWKGEYIDAVEITHRPPPHFPAKLAMYSVKIMRFNFDWMSGYSFGKLTERKCLSRILFLETVAGVPGSVAAMLRHLKSLRTVQRDHGWIHTLLEEAENERMHMLVGLQLMKPGVLFRGAIWLTQGIFTNFFFLSYLISPRFCHSFVGYLEEEAVKTYTSILQEIDHGVLQHWKTQLAPEIARKYWSLAPDATMRDVIAVIRADEAHHRDVNHAFSSLKPNEKNPFPPGF